MAAVTCATATFCVAVGDSIVVSNDGGVTWTLRSASNGIGSGSLRSVSCSTATQCTAVGANIAGESDPTVSGIAVETTDGGATWQTETLPSGTAAVDEVACTTGSQCFAGGFNDASGQAAAFATSSDGGSTWSSQSAPAGLTQIAGVSCPAQNNCVVVGRAGIEPVSVATTDGQTWTATSTTPSASSQ